MTQPSVHSFEEARRRYSRPALPPVGEGIIDAEIGIVGSAPSILACVDLARRFAVSSIPVLLVGETGTGKELLASLVHKESGRSGEFIDVDCGALPDDLTEGLLFGHKRGAFTGAYEHTRGLIESADQGSLFLDEIASLSLAAQRKLLRVLETEEVRRIGASRSRRVDFRLIAAAQTDIGARVADGSFRLDLFQRVAGAVIQIPPLSRRLADVIVLARHFARRVGKSLAPDAEESLVSRSWPGNVRELRWVVERAALLTRSHEIDRNSLRESLASGGTAILECSGPASTEAFHSELRAACLAHGGDPDLIAGALGVGRSTLYRRLREAGLRLRDFRLTQ